MSWIEYDSESRREAFRYVALDGHPIFEMTFLNQQVSVLDISAGGLSFPNDNFQVGQKDQVTIFLEGFHYRSRRYQKKKRGGGSKRNDATSASMGGERFFTTIEIIQIDEQNICHGIFEALSEEETDMLHQFILERQKQDIRNKKKENCHDH